MGRTLGQRGTGIDRRRQQSVDQRERERERE